MDPLIGQGIVVGIEIYKLIQQERAAQAAAAAAGLTPEQLKEAVDKARKDLAARDPNDLKEV